MQCVGVGAVCVERDLSGFNALFLERRDQSFCCWKQFRLRHRIDVYFDILRGHTAKHRLSHPNNRGDSHTMDAPVRLSPARTLQHVFKVPHEISLFPVSLTHPDIKIDSRERS